MGQKQAYWLLALCLPALLLFQQFAGEAGGALAPHHSLAHVQDESVANQFLPLMNVPAATPTLTPTPTFTPTSPPTSSATPTPTSTATATETVPASSSATPTATSTATNTPTTTASSTATNTPTATSTGTATATTTGTATATATNTPTATSTGTATATATNTPTATATGTATATATNTPTATASPTPGGPPTPGPAVLVGAGDMVECGEEGHEATADLLDDIPGTVFTTGDNIQAGGATLENFENCYEPSWGRHKARTNPAIGNHDYDDAPDAEGYFAYFGDGFGEPGQGYYSYDRGDWHIIVLNSNCGEVDGGCGPSSPQVQWLEQELADNPNACTLAYFHHPRFRAINNNEENGVTIFWQRLYDAGADVILSSHDHIYARFPLVDPDGNPDPVTGIRMFTVGTGGTGLDNNQRTEAPVPDSWIRAWGVLKLELYATSYDWEFIPVPGQSGAESDSGSGVCHGPPGG